MSDTSRPFPGPAPALPPVPAPILAVETSCDDTACALLDDTGALLGEALLSQEDHAALGGVVPELAARAHLQALPGLVDLTLRRAGLPLEAVGLFAATTGPGLIGGLIVGSSYAKGLAMACGRPFMGINHIEGHILTPRLPATLRPGEHPPAFPYLALLVSGGHCQCISVEETGLYHRLGGTIDDSAGEAFDKVAKMLGLGWPGGPALEALALEGDPRAFALPRPLKGRPGCDFSFSGLKTAVSRHVAGYGRDALPRQLAADLAASFQQAVSDVMADRITHALAMAPQATALVVAGGVAANNVLRQRLESIARSHGLPFLAPPLRFCTDNAAMIGWAALERLRQGEQPDDTALAPRPRWPLAERQPWRSGKARPAAPASSAPTSSGPACSAGPAPRMEPTA